MLKPYQGRDVLTSSVSIRNAGDGLSKAMKIDPVELPLDSTVHVVLECEVTKHTYEEIEDTNALNLVHVLKAGVATIVEASVVQKFIDDQKRRLAEAAGQTALSLDSPDDGEDDDEDDEQPF